MQQEHEGHGSLTLFESVSGYAITWAIVTLLPTIFNLTIVFALSFFVAAGLGNLHAIRLLTLAWMMVLGLFVTAPLGTLISSLVEGT